MLNILRDIDFLQLKAIPVWPQLLHEIITQGTWILSVQSQLGSGALLWPWMSPKRTEIELRINTTTQIYYLNIIFTRNKYQILYKITQILTMGFIGVGFNPHVDW